MTTKAPDTVAAAWRWQQHDFRAMNTGVHLSLYTARKRPIGDHVVGLFRYFEQILSRFRPASELSRLNSHPDTAFAASPDLFAAVEAALWAAQQTEGIYDPTILPALERAGYDRTFDALTTAPLTRSQPDDLFLGVEPAADFSFHDVMLDSFTQTIYRPVGLRLDLGGMGKGWTADRVADDLRPKGAFMLNAGGDMVVSDAPHRPRGWTVHLAHPLQPERMFATLSLANRALATSTIARRRWVQAGTIRHHLIDPRTGCPAVTDALAVSVVGPRVFTAEIHAKVALILGLDAGLAYLEAQPDVEGVLVGTDGTLRLTGGMGHWLDRLDPTGYDQPN